MALASFARAAGMSDTMPISMRAISSPAALLMSGTVPVAQADVDEHVAFERVLGLVDHHERRAGGRGQQRRVILDTHHRLCACIQRLRCVGQPVPVHHGHAARDVGRQTVLQPRTEHVHGIDRLRDQRHLVPGLADVGRDGRLQLVVVLLRVIVVVDLPGLALSRWRAAGCPAVARQEQTNRPSSRACVFMNASADASSRTAKANVVSGTKALFRPRRLTVIGARLIVSLTVVLGWSRAAPSGPSTSSPSIRRSDVRSRVNTKRHARRAWTSATPRRRRSS